jgi:hypothetical protein
MSKKNVQGSSVETTIENLLLGGDFIELRMERTIYAPEACGDVPLVGFVVDLLDMKPIGEGKNKREWKAFLIRTTQATKGLDRNKDVVDVGVDEEIIVPATHQLMTAISRFATDPSVMFQVAIAPKEKIEIGGGQTMWTYRVLLSKQTKKREGAYVLAGHEAPAFEAPSEFLKRNENEQQVARA